MAPSDDDSVPPKSPGLPPNVRLLKQPQEEADVVEALNMAREHADDIQGVLIITLNKDGSQGIVSSSMTCMERVYLIAFAQSFMTRHWSHEEE